VAGERRYLTVMFCDLVGSTAAPRCSSLRTGSKNSACPSTPVCRKRFDFSILAELTDQDLEKIGVASLGHRRKNLARHCWVGERANGGAGAYGRACEKSNSAGFISRESVSQITQVLH